MIRTITGVALGGLFIVFMQRLLERHEDLKMGDLAGASAQKMILIVFVMTLHSLTEGVGIGERVAAECGTSLKYCATLCRYNSPFFLSLFPSRSNPALSAGVSFGGKSGMQLGQFISLSLAGIP